MKSTTAILTATAMFAGALLVAACGTPSEPPKEAAALPVVTSTPPPAGAPVSINAEMVAVVDHAAHGLWDVEKEGKAPKTAADWEVVAEHAIQLAAAGTLITLPGTGVNDITMTQQDKWKTFARQMSDEGLAAYKATQAKDMKALVEANSQLVETCQNCHSAFKPALPSEGISHMHMHVEGQ